VTETYYSFLHKMTVTHNFGTSNYMKASSFIATNDTTDLFIN